MKTKRTLKLLGSTVGAALLASGVGVQPAMACGSSDSFIGSMCVFAGNFAPRNYALANGQLLSIASNSALFSILGTTYGGDGRTTFGLPDARGRALIGAGQGPGLANYPLGARGGSENHTLNIGQMPGHNHIASTTTTADATVHASTSLRGNSDNPDGRVWARKGRETIYSDAVPDVTMSPAAVSVEATSTTTVGNTGGNQPFNIRAPYLSVNWIITLFGTFPSRS